MKYFIYKLFTENGKEAYIGSTKKEINIRLIEHRSSSKINSKGRASSKLLFDKFGLYKVLIEKLEEIETDKIEEVKNKEKEWVDKLIEGGDIIINKRSPVLDVQKYNEKKKLYNKKSYLKRKMKNSNEVSPHVLRELNEL